jgi:hypothetical protein
MGPAGFFDSRLTGVVHFHTTADQEYREGVRAITEEEFRERLRAEAKALGGQKQLAERIGASEQYVSDVLGGRRKPGRRFLDWFRLRRREVYEADSGDVSEA